MNAIEGLTLRWLHGAELAPLEPILKAEGAMSLNPETTYAIAVFHEEQLVGFFCLQQIPHLEPRWVHPEYRGSAVSPMLVNEMVRLLKSSDARGAMLVADRPAVAKLAEHFGMTPVAGPMYQKVNMGDGL